MILVTGATGFVGSALITDLLDHGNQVRAIVRRNSSELPQEVEQFVLADLEELALNSNNDVVTEALNGVDVVVHTAARVHMMNEGSVDPLATYRKVNTLATLNLAKQAAQAGVKRFVFLSSIKVNGEKTSEGHPFTPEDLHIPDDPYGISKYEAEQGLLSLAKEMDMEVVIIRPPLVYGPGVRANFASMMKWINKGVYLPLGAIHNQRSLVALENLVNFIELCADRMQSPQAANQVFLISDGEDVSTTQLLRKVAKAFNKKARLIPVPVVLMSIAAKFVGKGDISGRLFGSLQVDSSKARSLLGWKPVISMDEQLLKVADAYLKSNKR